MECTHENNTFPCGIDAYAMNRKVLPCLMDIGEAMLIAGADVNLVETFLLRMGHAYGAYKMNVLVITASVIVTMTLPDGTEYTQTRRVANTGETDFAKLEALANLCRTCIKDPLEPDELRRRYSEIVKSKFPRVALYLGGMLSVGSFTIFFGGSALDGVISTLFAIFLCFMLERFRPLTPNIIVFNFIASTTIGLLIGISNYLLPDISVAMIMIGDIMLLIPGVAMTNATRDMISGDTISGVMRFIESLVWATAIALGFMIALWIMRISADPANMPVDPVIQLVTSIPAALGFALFFNVRKDHIVLATLGGFLTEGMYLLFYSMNSDIFVACLFASLFAAIYSEALSRHYHLPTSIFFIISVIPLVPGRGLFYTMNFAVSGEWSQCIAYALMTLQFALAIAIGIIVIWSFSRTWSNMRTIFLLRKARRRSTKLNKEK